MGIKLEKLLERQIEGIALFEVSYKYAPIYAKNHFARAKDEFVIYCRDSEKNKGVLWLKNNEYRFIPINTEDRRSANLLINTDDGIILISKNRAWKMGEDDKEFIPINIESPCIAENITEISTLGERGKYPVICRVSMETMAANSFTFFKYDKDENKIKFEDILQPVFTTENTMKKFFDSLFEAEGLYHKMDFNYNYPQIGSMMIKDDAIYVFLEADIVNPVGLSSYKYYWYVEITKDGVYKKKIWGKEKLEKLQGKHGVRGKFSADKKYLIISPIFKTDEWKGKQKLLRLSDLELLDITLPRGYSKFRVTDIFDEHAFISDEVNKIILCKMTEG